MPTFKQLILMAFLIYMTNALKTHGESTGAFQDWRDEYSSWLLRAPSMLSGDVAMRDLTVPVPKEVRVNVCDNPFR